MKNIILLMVFLITGVSLQAQILKTKLDSVSYSLGAMIVKNMKQQGIEKVNVNLVAQAIKDALEGKAGLLNDKEANSCLTSYVTELNEEKTMMAKEEGENFLKENALRPEVTVLASGLQYEVMSTGDGPSPSATDKVKTHYHGMLINGKVFDSSVERGEPISFPVNGVIQGWQEALQLMKVGDKWKLYVPSDLAYGPRGAGGLIAPHSALIFEVELLGIE